jgi:hypothetical protein
MITFRPDHKVILRYWDVKTKKYIEKDISDDVVSINTNKAFARAAGGFQITTTFNTRIDSKRYDEIVKTDDIIMISLDAGDGKGMQSVMIGLVDRVGRVRSYDAEGRPQFRCRINGTDFGKLLMKHDCIVDITPLKDTETGTVTGGDNSEYLFRLAQGVTFSGTPKEILDSLFYKLFFNQLLLPQDYMDIWFPDVTPDDWQTYNWALLESTGSIWNAMKATANEPCNVLSTETYNGKFYVIHEKYPFDPTTGKLLCKETGPAPGETGTRGVLRTIDDRLVISEDLGLCDNERTNYVYLKAPQFVMAAALEGIPVQFAQGVYNGPQDEIMTHGFSPWEVTINFAPPNVPAIDVWMKDAALEPIKTKSEMLWTRVKNNHLLESGTLTIHGAPEYKVGDGGLMENGLEYFVEQVTHNYQIGMAGTTYQTSLGLTRGQEHKKTPGQ